MNREVADWSSSSLITEITKIAYKLQREVCLKFRVSEREFVDRGELLYNKVEKLGFAGFTDFFHLTQIKKMSVMRRAIIFFSFAIFAFAMFFVSPVYAVSPTWVRDFVDKPTTWTKEGGPYLVSGQVVVKAPLAIEAGTVVKFNMYNNSSLNIQSDFIVSGTAKEKVIFTALHDDIGGEIDNGSSIKPKIGDWSQISIGAIGASEVRIRHAEMRYSAFGIRLGNYPQTKGVSVKNCKLSQNGYGFLIKDTNAVIESNEISRNIQGVKIYLTTGTTKMTNNAIFGNGTGAETQYYYVDHPDSLFLDARNNWWGAASGPYHNSLNPEGAGNPVMGQVLFDPWLGEDPIQNPDPAIVIPGIMGSWKKDGKWQIDPIFHTYDNLIESMIAAGYENDGKELSVFPYEWRDSNKVNAVELKAKIQQIKNQTSRPKVDIVAHSMGGLLAREYIESNYYQNDVDQLITIGTPHLGAPKGYIKWEAGAFFADIFELAGKKFFEQEAKENGYDSIFHYIRGRPIESVRELLPVYDYLWDDNGTDYDLRVGYPENYPRNEFLENLNNAERIKMLENVELSKIIGKPEGERTTISGYNVISADMGELWEHGYPHGFEIPKPNQQGTRRSEGDRTVSLYSAESTNIPSNKKIYLQSNHNDLPTDAQQDILEILTGKRPENKIDEWQIDDILGGFIFSPVDIQVISPSNKRLGKNFETGGEFNEILGAYYTGFNTDTEFFVIPNPEDGEYRILTQGTGEGEYKIEIVKITESPDDPNNAIESSVTIETETQIDEIREAEVEVAGDEIMYNPDTTPPVIIIFSPEEKKYLNDQIIVTTYSVSDETSPNEKIEKVIAYDGTEFLGESIDLSLQHLGEHKFKITATDEAGNTSEEEITFQNTTNIIAIQNNVGHYWDLKMIKKKIARKYLLKKVKHLENLFALLEKIKNSKLKPKPREAAIDALEKIINADIDRLIGKINRRTPKWFDQNIAELLIESLTYLKME